MPRVLLKVHSIFDSFDIDKSGGIDISEIATAMVKMGHECAEQEVKELFAQVCKEANSDDADSSHPTLFRGSDFARAVVSVAQRSSHRAFAPSRRTWMGG